jgi:hypothetical protein
MKHFWRYIYWPDPEDYSEVGFYRLIHLVFAAASLSYLFTGLTLGHLYVSLCIFLLLVIMFDVPIGKAVIRHERAAEQKEVEANRQLELYADYGIKEIEHFLGEIAPKR